MATVLMMGQGTRVLLDLGGGEEEKEQFVGGEC